MEWYTPIKLVHVLTIHITIALLSIRFIMAKQGITAWRKKPLKYIPHINDTLLLISAVGLIHVTGWQVGVHFWLTLKITLVVLYIIFGWVALRSSTKTWESWIFFLCTLLTYGAIYATVLHRYQLAAWPWAS